MPAEEVTEEVVEEPEIPLDPQTALFRVIQTSLHHEGLARGLHEAVKGQHNSHHYRCRRAPLDTLLRMSTYPLAATTVFTQSASPLSFVPLLSPGPS